MLVRQGAVAEYFLTRKGRVFVEASSAQQPPEVVQALDVQLAELGYLLSSRLRERLATLPDDALASGGAWLAATLAAHRSATVKKGEAIAVDPVFFEFPRNIPADTRQLWLRRMIALCFGEVAQPCPNCGRKGTNHLLEPCHHVVCDACFDGSNYTACPICLRQVARPQPFFQPSAEDRRSMPKEKISLVRIDLADEDLDAATLELFGSFCARQQPLSPDDRAGLEAIVKGKGVAILDVLPEKIPLRENVALLFGSLLRHCPAERVLPVASRYLVTATDVLRLLAVFSGADASLAPVGEYHRIETTDDLRRWHGRPRLIAEEYRVKWPKHVCQIATKRRRFRMATLPRPMRRTVLALLDRLAFESLADDMIRHRSAWLGAGEAIHPHEYASRYPNAARVFAILRERDPAGTPAPAYQTWSGRVEGALRAGQLEEALSLLERRPGELGRRFDRLLRIASARASQDPNAATPVVKTFERIAGKLSTPLLVALSGHLPSRLAPLPARVFFPKASTSLGPSGTDTRPPLSADVVTPALGAVTKALLERFATRPPFDHALVDARLRDVTAPFVERTGSPSAISLTRGSRLPLPPSPTVRLFLHWCEPKKGIRTDIDLSVGFFDADWNYQGACSFSQLTFALGGHTIAVSSGDFTSAPHPDGASEYVDVNRAAARAAGLRYAVMVVNAFSGMAFSELERAFAGFMLRDDTSGKHFDPRTVALRFGLEGDNGVFMPVVVDLADDVLHWIDVYSKGGIRMNTVGGSKSVLARVGAAFLAYFGAGARASMWDLARWHAAARCRHVFVRSTATATTNRFDRRDDETMAAFARRIDEGRHDLADVSPPTDRPLLAALLHGDQELPAGSESYLLLPDVVHGTVAAADWVR